MSATDIQALVAAAFGSAEHPLAAWYAGMLGSVPPLRAFTATYATKIRKKARQAPAPAEQRDLRCELALAAALCTDRRSPLVYEPLAAAGRRGPDFLLRHKDHSEIYVEVSRLRPSRTSERDPAERMAGALCGKLEQLPAGAANLLVLISDAGPFAADAITTTIQNLRRRAADRDDPYFAFRGLDGARAFQRGLPRLSALLVVAPAEATQSLWLHAQARHQLPADLARTVASWRISTLIGPNQGDNPE
ncbi:MAG: hypothetical protein HC822_08240 [Oscillochloris sp.]|nr:hypothetical protein [Oscillochloris sp.]